MIFVEAKNAGSPISGAPAPVLCCFEGEKPVLIHPRRKCTMRAVKIAQSNDDEFTNSLSDFPIEFNSSICFP